MIVNIIANYFEVSEKTICGFQDRREINEARDLLIYFLHKKTDLNLLGIGAIVGKRKKTTIHDALKRVKNRIEVYPEIKDQIKEIDTLIKKQSNFKS